MESKARSRLDLEFLSLTASGHCCSEGSMNDVDVRRNVAYSGRS